MLLFCALYSLIVINLLKFVSLKPFDESSIVEEIKSWSPLENSEVVKIYYFNIKNLDDYISKKSAKIEVEELQPFVFLSERQIPKFVNLSSNGAVANFNFKNFYSLDKKAMKNLDLNKTITKVDAKSVGFLDDFSKTLISLFETQFNYTNKECTKLMFKSLKIADLDVTENDFSTTYTYGIQMGKSDSILEGKIFNVNGRKGPKCYEKDKSKCYNNAVDVHLQFLKNKPFPLKKEDKLKLLFFDEPMTFSPKKSFVFKGLNLIRYELDESAMSMRTKENKFLCEDKNKKINGVSLCDMSGVLDMKKCALIPKVYSNPHFLDAPNLKSHIKGLKPDEAKHRSYVDVDPFTGVILNYRFSMQFNVFIKISKLGYKTNDVLVPYYWAEYFSEKSDDFITNYKRLKDSFTHDLISLPNL